MCSSRQFNIGPPQCCREKHGKPPPTVPCPRSRPRGWLPIFASALRFRGPFRLVACLCSSSHLRKGLPEAMPVCSSFFCVDGGPGCQLAFLLCARCGPFETKGGCWREEAGGHCATDHMQRASGVGELVCLVAVRVPRKRRRKCTPAAGPGEWWRVFFFDILCKGHLRSESNNAAASRRSDVGGNLARRAHQLE